ncbi:hypothetical protein FRC07_004625 [Ceratobasidium sp. 392]|nr:hypothetical protein FRC07_004625 [Ceratobasidium sp. 392]
MERIDDTTIETRQNPKVQISGQATSPSTVRLFSFGKRVLTDKEDNLNSDSNLGELNTIRLHFYWVYEGKWRPKTAFSIPRAHGPINEKVAKKGHAGSAGLGDTTTAIGGRYATCSIRLVAGVKPIKFIFHYAPEDWLQAREIVPLTSSSLKRERSTTPDVIDIDDLETDDDEVTIVKHMAPVPLAPASKRRKIKNEDDTKPKPEL